jgi:hypothetical protein
LFRAAISLDNNNSQSRSPSQFPQSPKTQSQFHKSKGYTVSVNMSGAPTTGTMPPTTKATTNDSTQPPKDQKLAAALEEDDEFEDFPVEGMSAPDVYRKRAGPPLWLVDLAFDGA